MTTLNNATDHGQAKSLGTARWVPVVFMVFGLLLFWVLEKLVTAAWQYFAEPSTGIVTVGSFVVAVVVTLALHRNPKIKGVTSDIVAELTRVTWPSRNETQAATVVVIIASIIASVIVGTFDGIWSWVTDHIY